MSIKSSILKSFETYFVSHITYLGFSLSIWFHNKPNFSQLWKQSPENIVSFFLILERKLLHYYQKYTLQKELSFELNTSISSQTLLVDPINH